MRCTPPTRSSALPGPAVAPARLVSRHPCARQPGRASRRGRLHGRPLALGLALLVTHAVAGAPPATAQGQAADAFRRTKLAAKLIQEKRYGEALQELDRAIEQAPSYWEAHYQRGRALGLQGKMQEALSSLLRATELRPGMAHAHELAALAAWESGDHELAWSQIVNAFLAGGSVENIVRRWASQETPPADLVQRMSAPRVYVAPLDVQEIENRAELPFNRNPMAREDPSRSGVPADIQGRDRLREAWAELARVERQFRRSIQDSPVYGLVLDESQCEYILRIAVDELGEKPPRNMQGYLELVARESGKVGYRRNFALRNIDAAGDLRGQIELMMDDMEAWLQGLRGER